MGGGILALIIVSLIASLIVCYQCFNHGRLHCLDTTHIDNHGEIVPE